MTSLFLYITDRRNRSKETLGIVKIMRELWECKCCVGSKKNWHAYFFWYCTSNTDEWIRLQPFLRGRFMQAYLRYLLIQSTHFQPIAGNSIENINVFLWITTITNYTFPEVLFHSSKRIMSIDLNLQIN